jgi:hypothetical protein
MKTAISIPDRTFHAADQLARRLGLSRSELYARAVSALLDAHRDELVTAKLNDIYGTGGQDSAVDPALAAAQSEALASKRW